MSLIEMQCAKSRCNLVGAVRWSTAPTSCADGDNAMRSIYDITVSL